MKLSNITIRNFRRLKNVTIDFDTQETVFVGPNNSGKTSATASVRSFLGNRDFRIHDFSVSRISEIDAFDLNNENSRLPSIELDLWFSIDPESIAFGQVFALATGISSDFTEIGIRCSYQVRDSYSLWLEYNGAFPQDEDGQRRKSLSHFLGLENRLRKHFNIQFASLERDLETPTPLDPSEGKRVLATLLRVDFVDAQRNIDDEDAARSNKLSEAFASYYRKNLIQAETVEEAVQVIDENNERLSEHYATHFKPLMKTIQGLGVPSVNDRELRIVSSLSSEAALKGSTDLLYVDAGSQHELPEAYNGLGFKNLVFMAIQIDHFHRHWINTEENRPLCQMIFIEEPEVHLHAQVQQTFIRNMWKILDEASSDGDAVPQLAVTTHSSHVLDAVDFSKVRYFRRCPAEGADANAAYDETTVHSLQDFEPEAVEVDGIQIEPQAALAFLKKYLKLTHCDLFFADAAILVEGTVEKLLIPEMIGKAAHSLNQRYLTTLEVGGAYALRFEGLLRFLEIPYLVITDIDSVDPNDNRRSCRADTVDAVTSNASIKHFFPNDAIDALASSSRNDCEQAEGMRFVSFQKPIEIDIDGNAHEFHGRTLEETFVYENLASFKNGIFNIGVSLPEDVGELYDTIWKRIGSAGFKKTEFALDVLASDENWAVPSYIGEGLNWLQEKLEKGSPDPLTNEAAQ